MLQTREECHTHTRALQIHTLCTRLTHALHTPYTRSAHTPYKCTHLTNTHAPHTPYKCTRLTNTHALHMPYTRLTNAHALQMHTPYKYTRSPHALEIHTLSTHFQWKVAYLAGLSLTQRRTSVSVSGEGPLPPENTRYTVCITLPRRGMDSPCQTDYCLLKIAQP
jgi:ribosomal protein S10